MLYYSVLSELCSRSGVTQCLVPDKCLEWPTRDAFTDRRWILCTHDLMASLAYEIDLPLCYKSDLSPADLL